MKKTVKGILTVIISIMVLSVLMLAGCGKTTAAETQSTETVAGTSAENTTEATTAAETPVAGEEELYIYAAGEWGMEHMQPFAWGGYLAAKELGVKFELAGPDDWVPDVALAGLETAISKKPTGILWINYAIGEDKLLTDYYNAGGLVAGMNGSQGNYPVTFLCGTDNTFYGEMQAKKVVELLGDKAASAKIGIMSLPTASNHIKRINGVKNIVAQNPGMEIVGDIIDQTNKTEQAAANASAFLAAHPDVNAIICTSAFGGAAVGLALKEAGIEPGKVIVIAGDFNSDLLQLIDEGYIQATLGQSFSVESYYAVLVMHALHNSTVYVSNDDAAIKFTAGPANVITNLPFIDKSNMQYFVNLKAPEGYTR